MFTSQSFPVHRSAQLQNAAGPVGNTTSTHVPRTPHGFGLHVLVTTNKARGLTASADQSCSPPPTLSRQTVAPVPPWSTSTEIIRAVHSARATVLAHSRRAGHTRVIGCTNKQHKGRQRERDTHTHRCSHIPMMDVSQRVPVNCAVHTHPNVLPAISWHLPPFSHGVVAHGTTSTDQSITSSEQARDIYRVLFDKLIHCSH